MKYDSIVVGAGLAGLTAALRLAESEQRVLLIAKGVGATHLAPATIDVLGYADDSRVENPQASLPRFVESHPEHPYARVSPELIAESLDWLSHHATGLGYAGGLDQNWLLPTAIGVPKPTALAPETMVGGDLRRGGKFVFVGLRGLKDFNAAYVSNNLEHANLPATLSTRALELEPPVGRDVVDVGTLGFARRFEEAGFRDWIVEALMHQMQPDERVGFPAVLGLENTGTIWRELERRLEHRVFEVPLLPPSAQGIRLYEALTRTLRSAGGRILIGDRVVGGETENGRVAAVVAQTASRPVAYQANSVVLASGGFASVGLEMDSHGVVRETVFGLPPTGVPESGRPKFSPDYFDGQPLARAGLAVDELLRPVGKDGRAVYENLHAAGAIIGGAIPWREHSGNGISLATGYAAASAILKKTATMPRTRVGG
jgi:glycerol-3-phosphate dehydrogenase subunit B